MRIALIGCGKMGGAMLDKWLQTGLAEDIDVIKPSSLSEKFNKHPKVHYFNSVASYAQSNKTAPDVVVLAIGPSEAETVCTGLKDALPQETLVLSIITGKTISFLEKHFGENQPVVRSMPNTPSQIGKGITVAIANGAASQTYRDLATRILETSGETLWTENEPLINVVAAISGSGPAYFNLFAEKLAQAGEEHGLPPELAMKLARQTLIGTGAMAEKFPEATLEDLRLQVTSPGGSTAEAVKSYLQNDALLNVQRNAVAAAVRKNQELGGTAPANEISPVKKFRRHSALFTERSLKHGSLPRQIFGGACKYPPGVPLPSENTALLVICSKWLGSQSKETEVVSKRIASLLPAFRAVGATASVKRRKNPPLPSGTFRVQISYCFS